jgi:hypothetical protein
MTHRWCTIAALLLAIAPAFALDGEPAMHDPSAPRRGVGN